MWLAPTQTKVHPMRDKRTYDRIRLLSRADLAEAFGVSEWTIWSWRKKGLLPVPIKMTPGSKPKWRACDIEILLDRKQREAKACRKAAV
jgi:predicted DNA-binding transcriptional regulator AlpA